VLGTGENIDWLLCELIGVDSGALTLFLKGNPEAQHWIEKQASRHGKGKALAILAKKLGQTVYAMLTKNRCFDEAKFMAHLQ
jgi:hypothetical protein